ncbi:MAG: 4-(cytidine 5'-diphospho)-2-C-methyl-D-erythritol kinase [Spirochaetales bacterium]|nr:4-(cytidine 5'-diphospho)-2-C-methyl-D-erythritol kinase [Spirochaetales bacterium]
MPEILDIASYAKINLHLDVGNRRNDGFHNINSIFQAISLHDSIDMVITEKTDKTESIDNLIEINGKFTCPKDKNLIYRAASSFMLETGLRFHVKFNVEKVIPEGAGLGGGSSNAAAVLKNLYSQFPVAAASSRNITSAAASLGSDVPFFLDNNTALVSGRGETINPVDIKVPAYKILLVYPGFKVNTAQAYSWIDSERSGKEYKISEVDLSVLSRNPSEWKFFNSFRNPLVERYDIYKRIFSVYKNYGSDYFNITGSGSAVFGIFSDIKKLEPAYNELSELCPDIWITDMHTG